MFEMEVLDYVSMEATKAVSECEQEVQPILIFQGEEFESLEKFTRLKSLLIDFFKVHEWKEANILELKRILVFTSTSDETISCAHYECGSSISEPLVLSVLNPNQIKDNKDKTPQKKVFIILLKLMIDYRLQGWN